jgi:hypothetical protein
VNSVLINRTLGNYLRVRGWDDAGRHCWSRGQSTEPSLILRWTDGLTLDGCRRILGELQDLQSGLQAILQQSKLEMELS